MVIYIQLCFEETYECKIQLDFPDNASRNTLRLDFECHNCIIFPSTVGEKVISPWWSASGSRGLK